MSAPGDNHCPRHGPFAGRHCPECEAVGSVKGDVWAMLVIVAAALIVGAVVLVAP